MFQPQSIPYTGLHGKPLVLRIGTYKGHKSYWVETPEGKRLTARHFYNEASIAHLLPGNTAKEN